jgi:glycine cleavage system H protein
MSAADEVKDDRRYTKDHEWAKTEGNEILVGITAFAVDQLGDITLVGLDVAPGDEVETGQVFGTVESVKTVSDLFAPLSGKITRINAKLDDAPELVNEDPWGESWMVAIEPADDGELMDAAAYRKLIADS